MASGDGSRLAALATLDSSRRTRLSRRCRLGDGEDLRLRLCGEGEGGDAATLLSLSFFLGERERLSWSWLLRGRSRNAEGWKGRFGEDGRLFSAASRPCWYDSFQ